jgi:tetratricopeptide (TPR) repeat protein
MYITNSHFTLLPAQERAQVHALVQRFEEAWLRGDRPALADYLPAATQPRRAALLELIHAALEFQIRAGEPTALGAYLERFPEILEDGAAVRELAAQEYELRRRVAPAVPPAALSAPAGTGPSPPPADQVIPVLRLLGRYEMLHPLGTGACGTVYLARDTHLDRLVAVKLPRLGRLAGPEEVGRFVREARSTAQFCHSGIVPVHDAGQVDGLCYLVSEYIPGTTLSQRLAAGPLPPDEAAWMLRRVAEALDYAHRHGVIHRDVKPSNILLDGQDRPHLADFGLARRTTGEHTLTGAGEVLGTPAYMSPEQAGGEAHRVDGRSDIYSLGVVLYEALTGRLPLPGTPGQVLRRVLEEEPRPPRRLDRRIPRDLETVCLKALAKDPERRYPTARALADDLARYLERRPVQARPVGRLTRLVRWCRRQPVATGLVAALVLGITGTAWENRRAGALFQEAEHQRARAEHSREQAQQAISEFARLSLHDFNYERVRLEPGRLALIERALNYFEAAPGSWSQAPAIRADAARAYLFLARTYAREAANQDQARAAYEKALALAQGLIRDDPARTQDRILLGEVSLFFGEYLAQHGRGDRAFVMLQDATSSLVTLHPAEWDEPMHRFSLAEAYFNLGVLACDLGRAAEALAWHRKSLALTDQLIQADPSPSHYPSLRGQNLFYLARAHHRLDHAADALRRYQESAAVWEELTTKHSDVRRYRQDLAACYHCLANLHRDAGRLADAVRLYRQALALRQQLCAEKPDDQKYQSDRDGTSRNLTQVLDQLSRATAPPERLKLGNRVSQP